MGERQRALQLGVTMCDTRFWLTCDSATIELS